MQPGFSGSPTHVLLSGTRGKHWLARLQNEYRDRFGIDFCNGPVAIERIEELALARNAGLHWEGNALTEYEQRVPNPRFLEFGIVIVSTDKLNEALEETKKFLGWVVDELKKHTERTAAGTHQ